MNPNGRRCALAMAAVSLAMAGCGSVTRTGVAARTGPAPVTATRLCAAVNEVGSLTVSRVVGISRNHVRFTFPPQVAARDPGQARAVARAVCGLPRMPRGPIFCPVDLGVYYRLDFGAGGRSFPVVTVSAGGCQQVSGAGPERWAARSPGFWMVLGRAIGVPLPGTAFGGCGGPIDLMCPQRLTYPG